MINIIEAFSSECKAMSGPGLQPHAVKIQFFPQPMFRIGQMPFWTVTFETSDLHFPSDCVNHCTRE